MKSFVNKLAKKWCDDGIDLNNASLYAAAIPCFDMAIAIDPSHADAYLHKGIALTVFDKYEEAIECYGKLIEIGPIMQMHRIAEVQLLRKLG